MIDDVTARFGIGIYTVLHSPILGSPRFTFLTFPVSVFFHCEVCLLGKWLWSSFSIVPFVVTCNMLSLIVHIQNFRIYVTPPPYLLDCLLSRFDRLIILSGIIFSVFTSPVFSSPSVWRFSSSSGDVVIGR